MRFTSKIFFVLTFSAAGLLSCLDPYSPPPSKEQTHFLVIDGYLNSSSNEVTVKISRSVSLTDTSRYPAVSGASVVLEATTDQPVSVPETSPGLYATQVAVNKESEYRLRVTTSGQNYVSEFIRVQSAAPLDSVTWRADDTQLEIYASTHDSMEGHKYYRYKFDETYEYKAIFVSDWKFADPVPVYRNSDESIYRCWITSPSTAIVLTSTENFSQNSISNFPIIRMYRGDRRLWHQYSALVKQIALSAEAYSYWAQLQKVTESLGGLFDPLPYQIKSNIKSVSNPDDVVLGYFSGGDVSEQRVTIRNFVLPNGYSGMEQTMCEEYSIPLLQVNTLVEGTVLLTRGQYEGITLVGFNYTMPQCADCRFGGGTNVKPDFMY